MHYTNSYKYGKEQEAKVLIVIKEFWNEREIIQDDDKYARYDFFCEDYLYELKSRTNKYAYYPTTMITCNKLQKNEKGIILLFNFTDGLYYIEYDEELFKTFQTYLFSRAEIQSDEKLHIYIPITELILIKKY